MFSDHIYLYALLSLPKLGPIKINQLLEFFHYDSKLCWESIDNENIQGISTDFLYHLQKEKKKINLFQLQERLKETNTQTIAKTDKDYPHLLKEIPDAPPLLFYKGILPNNQRKLITIVGTRTMSRYGESVLQELLPPLCQEQIGIISGLAFGIDAQSHRIAINQKTYTAAVLGSSVDKITPSRHDLLAQELLESGGAIISESPPKTNAYDGSFPRRNRILAGFSSLTLIIEAAEKSGALITARYALDYNRDIATIPGSIFSQTSKGCNNLLKNGAITITTPQDIIDALKVETQLITEQLPLGLSEIEILVLQLLKPEPQPIDLLLATYTGRSAELFNLLTMLELKNLVENIPGYGYALKKKL